MHYGLCENLSRREWLTAKMTTPSDARRFVRRLDALGFDYQVNLVNRQLRILVHREELQEILAWFEDMAPSDTSGLRTDPIDTSRNLRLLIAMPLGGSLGTLCSIMLGLPNALFTGVAAFCVSVVALSLSTNRPVNCSRRRNPFELVALPPTTYEQQSPATPDHLLNQKRKNF